ncbi:DUF6186 family protein [Amycolatopsis sp. NPDC003865]
MSTRVVTELGFGLIVLVAIGLGVASHVWPEKVPKLTSVLAVVMRRRSARIAFVLAWWWVGWHFFVGQ